MDYFPATLGASYEGSQDAEIDLVIVDKKDR